MAEPIDTSSPADSTIPAAPATPSQRSPIANIFMGPNGIRAGWRLLIFFVVIAALSACINFTIKHSPALKAWFIAHQTSAQFTPAGLLTSEGSMVLLLLLGVGIMALIEKRSFADYGMPMNEFLGKRFWQGVPLGFVMLSLLLGLMAALHGFSLEGLAVRGPDAMKYGLLYFIGFILVGIFEEFSFRGYLQSTLASGIGFWPAALVLSVVFGAVHLGNSGEAALGAFMAGSFGLVAAFALWRTGNLWVPIGMHASWDWGETYFYGTPDSGIVATGHLLNSSPHGAAWLSGGTVGPEGSWLVFLVLIIWVVVIHFLFPARNAVANQLAGSR